MRHRSRGAHPERGRRSLAKLNDMRCAVLGTVKEQQQSTALSGFVKRQEGFGLDLNAVLVMELRQILHQGERGLAIPAIDRKPSSLAAARSGQHQKAVLVGCEVTNSTPCPQLQHVELRIGRIARKDGARRYGKHRRALVQGWRAQAGIEPVAANGDALYRQAVVA